MLAIFDFDTLSWSQDEITGDALRQRLAYVATCHDNAMVIMGGELLVGFKLLKCSPVEKLDMALQSMHIHAPCCMCC